MKITKGFKTSSYLELSTWPKNHLKGKLSLQNCLDPFRLWTCLWGPAHCGWGGTSLDRWAGLSMKAEDTLGSEPESEPISSIPPGSLFLFPAWVPSLPSLDDGCEQKCDPQKSFLLNCFFSQTVEQDPCVTSNRNQKYISYCSVIPQQDSLSYINSDLRISWVDPQPLYN